jgi:superfamily II DNA/RNA helicase
MSADNTYLVDRSTVHGPKLEELDTLLKELVVEGDEKVVVFSQWLRMTELVAKLLVETGIGFVHLNGGVPSKNRKALMTRFKEDPSCRVFLSTDAGGVGLNLQSGSVVINMDIPWNPAILEQRIGRVHRMGQGKTVRVVNFVSRASIEERILDLLRFKSSLAASALDEDGSDSVTLGASGMEKYMSAVEQVVEALEVPAPGHEEQERVEALQDEEKAQSESTSEKAAAAVTSDQSGAEALNALLTGGAQFLMNLSRAITLPAEQEGTGGSTREKGVSSLIGRDETTGNSYLKIPLPQPDVLNQLISGLGALFAGLTKR